MMAKIKSGYHRDLSRIWAGAHDLGIDPDDLHLLLKDITGKESLKNTTPLERASLIRDLQTKGAYRYRQSRPTPRPRPGADGEKKSHANEMISPEQTKYIHDLFAILVQTNPDFAALNYQRGFIGQVLGRSRFYPQTRAEAMKIIEALKKRVGSSHSDGR